MTSDYISPKERKYQDAIVSLIRHQLGYDYLGKLQYAKGAKALEDGCANSPVIEGEVRRFLSSTKKYTPYQIDRAVEELLKQARLTSPKKGKLLDANNTLYETLISHVKAQPAPDKPHENVSFFDFDNPTANHFAIAEEVSYIDPLTGSHSRPDIVVYVNGIALAVIELKRSTVTLQEGIKQHLSNEADLIPSFFTTVQYTVAANASNDTGDRDSNGFRYATILTPEKFWTPWKKDRQEPGTRLSDTDSFLEFFRKDVFFDLFRYGVVNDGGTKKVMRPHQFHALRAAMPRLRDKASGVIWHSQGSGKSLTMVWLAKYIQRNFPDPRVLVITDRTELDMQIANTFTHATGAIHRAKSSDDLLSALHSGTEWLVCSLIHKFGRHIDPDTGKEVIGDDDAPIPLETYLKELTALVNSKFGGKFRAKGTHKFVFVDECHRTQSGRLHEAMRAIMGDDVMFIGFTGTPLLHDQKKRGYQAYRSVKNESEHRFGEFIHKYLHKEAVDDRVILDLQYEARDVEQEITSQDKLDKKKEELLHGLNDANKQAIEDRWATLQKVYSSSERIHRIGYSILDDMKRYPLTEDWCNAMLVAGDIYSAYKYYEFFTHISPDKTLADRCAVVTSYSPSDSDKRKQNDGDDSAENEIIFKNVWATQSYKDAGVSGAEQYEAWAKRLFVKAPSRMKLLIVVDKLLTGFDAPSATYLYIDKDMRDHNLFQAICRVNRLGTDLKEEMDNPDSRTIFSHKEFGLIVDFKHLFDNIEDAIKNFNDGHGALSGFDQADLEGLLSDALVKNSKRLELALAAYRALKADWERQEVHTADDVVRHFCPAIPVDLPEEEHKARESSAKAQREMFYAITQALGAAYANISDYILRAGYPEQEADTIHREVCEASNLNRRVRQASGDDFDVKQYDAQMRALLDRFIRADDAESIVPPTADFSFLDLLTADTDTEDAAKKAVDEAKGRQKAAAEVIEAKARAVINDWGARDPELALSFAKRLQALIDELNKHTADTAQKIRRLIDLLKAMKGTQSYPEGVTTRFARALWNNRASWTDLADEAAIVALIGRLEHFFNEDVYADWRDFTSPDHEDCMFELKNLLGNSYNDEQRLAVFKLASQNITQK